MTAVARPRVEPGSTGQWPAVIKTPIFALPRSLEASQYWQLVKHCRHHALLYPVPISIHCMRRIIQLKTC